MVVTYSGNMQNHQGYGYQGHAYDPEKDPANYTTDDQGWQYYHPPAIKCHTAQEFGAGKGGT